MQILIEISPWDVYFEERLDLPLIENNKINRFCNPIYGIWGTEKNANFLTETCFDMFIYNDPITCWGENKAFDFVVETQIRVMLSPFWLAF